MRALLFFLLLLAMTAPLATASSCRTTSETEAANSLAEQLAANLTLRLDRSQPVVPTVFVPLDDVEATSPLGRLLAERTADALARWGFSLSEVRLRAQSLRITPMQGEFALTRNERALASPVSAQAVLTGTYAQSGHILHVSARLIHAISRTVLSTADCELVLTPATRASMTPDSVGAHQNAALLSPANPTDTRAIQSRLKELGLYRGKIDGIWGKHTQAAVDAFRRIRGIASTAKWDMATQQALLGS
ncbi:MAG: hypothetical protein JG774_963 [Desulfomicrobiaceae bacterium]|jgi:predicted ABC-class ATPase|nr:peptidoglycan-binding protein [Desulfomicrobiaceae bacterium]MBZ4685218.1 hypothetical protein [Desulfomicrobiaceae bacterium]